MMRTNFSGCYGVHQLFLIMLLMSCRKTLQSVVNSDDQVVVAFGSCNRQNKPQEHWDFIRTTNPDLFIWTGDHIDQSSSQVALYCSGLMTIFLINFQSSFG